MIPDQKKSKCSWSFKFSPEKLKLGEVLTGKVSSDLHKLVHGYHGDSKWEKNAFLDNVFSIFSLNQHLMVRGSLPIYIK